MLNYQRVYIFTHFAFTVCESIETMAGLGALLPHQLLQLRQSLAGDGEMDFPWRHMVCSQLQKKCHKDLPSKTQNTWV
jgi:hypothetical protein